MNKKYEENVSYTTRMETKKRINTEITIEEDDDYIEIVTDELIRLLDTEAGVKRLWCNTKPNVYLNENNVSIYLNLTPPHEFSRKEKLEFISNDQNILNTIYELCNKTIDLWYEDKLDKGKRHN